MKLKPIIILSLIFSFFGFKAFAQMPSAAAAMSPGQMMVPGGMPQYQPQISAPGGRGQAAPQMPQAQAAQPAVPRTAPTITPVTTDSRIRTLVYNANEVYQLKFHYGYQSYIEFSSDEDIEMISIGESFAWRLTPAGRRLFVRPLEIGAHTNMTIITNKRTYQFDIASAEYDGRADEQLVYVVRFYYPELAVPLPIPPQLSQPNPGFKSPAHPEVKKTIAPQFIDQKLKGVLDTDGKNLNFRYSITGRSNKITPLKVFDDGRETFFQFKDDNLVVPNISTVSVAGLETPLGYVVRDGFIVVETTAPQFTLRLGSELLCIFNEKIAAAPSNSRINFYETVVP